MILVKIFAFEKSFKFEYGEFFFRYLAWHISINKELQGFNLS